jgi:hypothetical protein
VSVVSCTRTDPEHARRRWQIGHRVNQHRPAAVKIPNVESVYSEPVIAKIGGSQCHAPREIVPDAYRLAIISAVPGLDSCQESKQFGATASCGLDNLWGSSASLRWRFYRRCPRRCYPPVRTCIPSRSGATRWLPTVVLSRIVKRRGHLQAIEERSPNAEILPVIGDTLYST